MWRVERGPGHWSIEGWSDTHRLCGGGVDYTIQADLSRVTGRQAPPPQRWVAGAADVFWSPDGRWALLTTGNEVRLARRDQLDATVARASLDGDDSVVMVEWATGSNVARWREQVARLAKSIR